ncbi:MAG: metallophosphoesterase [Alistipes sp.]|nr:metallophosphoesterase [Alistipes sp.]
MKKFLFVAMLLCGIYSAQAIKIIHGPYLQAVSDTEATIMWVTDTKALSWVELAPNDGTNFYHVERPQYYQTYLGKRVYGTVHQIRITGLEPGKSYRYSTSSKEVVDMKGHRVTYGHVATTKVYGKNFNNVFTTLQPGKEKIQFIMLNDIHAKQEKMAALLNTFEKGKTDMVFYTGDMVSMVPTEDILFQGFVDLSVAHFAKQVPFYLARGNHETRGLFATSFMTYFPSLTGKPYYTLKHGDVFFIILDGGEDKPDSCLEYYETAQYDNYRKEEAEWLKGVVESEDCKNAKYRVVLMHMPPIGGKNMWHGPKHAGECFFPVLNKANITVMLSGHTHKYSYNTPETTDAEFPILVNAHNTALKANVNKSGITIDVIDTNGSIKHTHTFK